jgi:replicative DNA helicase
MRASREQGVELSMVAGRVPPHDLDAEAAVLSAVMIDPFALDRVLEFLKAEHFYSEAHRRIFEATVDLRSAGKPVDVVQVGTWLKDRGRIAQVGGMGYLTEVLNAAPAVANVAAYGRTIREKSRIRQLIATCQHVSAVGYLDYGDAQAFIDSAEQSVYEIARTPESTSVEKLLDVMKKAFKQLQDAATRGDRITGMATGFKGYDKRTAGLHEGDLTIIAARPGMGKTSFVLNVAANVAQPRGRELVSDPSQKWEEPGHGVVIFSLEMPREQLAHRMICSEGGVDVAKVRQGFLSQQDWSKLTQAAAYLGGLPIWIDDSPSLSILELRAKVRRLQAEYDRAAAPASPATGAPAAVKSGSAEGARGARKIGLVVVDYLQLMKGRDNVNSREQEISEISRGLKALAKELRISVIALSQLNRAVETRTEKHKRPQLSDLRESGAIEQDADNICFIYRDDYYNKEASTEPNIAELIIAKQRNGPTGTARVYFDKAYTRFKDLDPSQYPEDESE